MSLSIDIARGMRDKVPLQKCAQATDLCNYVAIDQKYGNQQREELRRRMEQRVAEVLLSTKSCDVVADGGECETTKM